MACPAGYTCRPLAVRFADGHLERGVFVVADPPRTATVAPTTTSSRPAPSSPTTRPPSRETDRAGSRAAPTTQPRGPVMRTRPPASPGPRATPSARPTPKPAPDALPGAVDLDAAQQRAEAQANGYGAPLQGSAPRQQRGVVPAPGCNAGNARPPDGRCS